MLGAFQTNENRWREKKTEENRTAVIDIRPYSLSQSLINVYCYYILPITSIHWECTAHHSARPPACLPVCYIENGSCNYDSVFFASFLFRFQYNLRECLSIRWWMAIKRYIYGEVYLSLTTIVLFSRALHRNWNYIHETRDSNSTRLLMPDRKLIHECVAYEFDLSSSS